MKRRRSATLILLLSFLTLLLPASAQAFPDVAATDPYRPAIENLAAKGVISGYTDGDFGPGDAVQRAQFAKMIVGALDVAVPAEGSLPPFADLGWNDPHTPYPHEYVTVAAEQHITVGTAPGTFSPWVSIGRAQVITMVVRAAENLEPGLLRTPPAAYQSSLGVFDATHGPSMARAQFNGLLSGLENYGAGWNAWADLSRGEAAQVLYNLVSLVEGSPTDGDLVPVTSVADGDTLNVIFGGREEAVRLIGFDSPEAGEPFAAQAAGYLRDLVNGRRVRLEFDVQERDRYQRLLAYVWIGSTMLNTEMPRAGLGTLYTLPPNLKHTALFVAAEGEARRAGRGMWGAPADCPLEIMTIHPDALGNDNYNLNDEWVEFRVLRAGSLIGYSVEDAAGHAYFFPDRFFPAGQVLRLHTGSGIDTQTDLYWGASSGAVWDNSGDTIRLLDAQGHVALSRTY